MFVCLLCGELDQRRVELKRNCFKAKLYADYKNTFSILNPWAKCFMSQSVEG